MSTKAKNVDLFQRVNEGYLQTVNPQTGRYNRDEIFEQIGVMPDPRTGDYSRVHLSDSQAKAFQKVLEQRLGFSLGDGNHIDAAGNVNEKGMSTAKKIALGAAIGGAALTGAGALGIGPLAGAFGGGASAAAGGGAAAATGGGVTAADVAAMGGYAGALGSGAKAAKGAADAIGAARSTADIVRDVIQAGGAAAGAGAETAAGNRASRNDWNLDDAMIRQRQQEAYDNAMLQRQQAAEKQQRNAYQDAMRAAYVKSATGKAPGFSPYSRDIAAPTDEQRAAAATMADAARRRLDNPYEGLPEPVRVPGAQWQEPGAGERLGGIAAGAAGVAGAIPEEWWKRIGRWIS